MFFKRTHFTKESFEKVGLNIDWAYTLSHFIRPLIALFEIDGISVSFSEMHKMLTGDFRQTQASKDKDQSHFLFIEHDKIDGNTHYIINKNFDWGWYEKQCEEEIINPKNSVIGENINELDLLRSIANMINKHFHEYFCPENWDDEFPDDIKKLMNIWNEKFNRREVK